MEGEFEPGSRGRVLRNALGIRTKSGMDRAEYEALEDAQDRYLDLVTDETVMTAPFICGMHAELLLIHPFREGNGRLARWLANLMCLQAGLPIPDFGFNQPGRGPSLQRRYLAAVIQGYQRDYRALTDVFRDALERSTEG